MKMFKTLLAASLAVSTQAADNVTDFDESKLDFTNVDELLGCPFVKVAVFGTTGAADEPKGFTYFTPSGRLGYSIGNLGQLDAISGVTDCAAGGLKYHIHDAWDNIEGDSATGGTTCGRANTQNHYDPGLACGGASNAVQCQSNGGCVSGSSAIGDTGYNCNSDTYSENNFACEVGDLSGKFGTAAVRTGNFIHDNLHEPYSPSNYFDALNGKSIVFHCGSGQRAFCAKLQ
jgi:hypothetical protein